MPNHGFAIVGCGMIAEFHAQAVDAMADATLVGCSSRNPDSATAFAEEHGCKAYGSLEELLADDAVTVVTVCTPSGSHLEPALAAAAAGKHLLIEKPLEITPDRCDQIIAACEKAGVKLGGILPNRFSPAAVELKKAVDGGRFGTLTLGDTYVKWWRPQEYYDSGGWRGTWKLDGGGATMNQAIHNVDLLIWLMGDVREVSAMTGTLAHERIEVEDVMAATVTFKNGAVGVLQATTAAFPGWLRKTEIHGTGGSACVEQDHIAAWDFAEETPWDAEVVKRFGKQSETSGGASDPKAISFVGHQRVFEDFLSAVENDTTPSVDGAESRRSVELITAIYEAARTGRRVTVGERTPAGVVTGNEDPNVATRFW